LSTKILIKNKKNKYKKKKERKKKERKGALTFFSIRTAITVARKYFSTLSIK